MFLIFFMILIVYWITINKRVSFLQCEASKATSDTLCPSVSTKPMLAFFKVQIYPPTDNFLKKLRMFDIFHIIVRRITSVLKIVNSFLVKFHLIDILLVIHKPRNAKTAVFYIFWLHGVAAFSIFFWRLLYYLGLTFSECVSLLMSSRYFSSLSLPHSNVVSNSL